MHGGIATPWIRDGMCIHKSEVISAIKREIVKPLPALVLGDKIYGIVEVDEVNDGIHTLVWNALGMDVLLVFAQGGCEVLVIQYLATSDYKVKLVVRMPLYLYFEAYEKTQL